MSNDTDWVGGISLDTIPLDIFDTYERRMVPAVFRPWAERLVDVAGLRAGERVLDLACATGVVARVAAERVGPSGSVAGLDLLPGMLEAARIASKDIAPQIQWVEGNALEMPLPDDSFDVVLCQQGLQFFPDKITALNEVRRVLASGGRALMSVWGPIEHSPAVEALQQALERHAPDVAGFLPVVFSLSDPEQMASLLREAGFSEVSVRPVTADVRFASVEDYLHTYLGSTPLGGIVSSFPEERRQAIGEEIAESVREYIGPSGVTFPQETNVASGIAP